MPFPLSNPLALMTDAEPKPPVKYTVAWKAALVERRRAKAEEQLAREREEGQRWSHLPIWKRCVASRRHALPCVMQVCRGIVEERERRRRAKEDVDRASEERAKAQPRWRQGASASSPPQLPHTATAKKTASLAAASTIAASSVRSPTPTRRALAADAGHLRRVEGVMKARLYLLQQSGPKAFIVGSDDVKRKYKVILGPQSCSCNRAHCVHVLFVMLRVLKVQPTDPRLLFKTLQNYEIEGLISDFNANRKTMLKHQCVKCMRHATPSHPFADTATRCARSVPSAC